VCCNDLKCDVLLLKNRLSHYNLCCCDMQCAVLLCDDLMCVDLKCDALFSKQQAIPVELL
jgi:hypothetical protein